MLYTAPTPTLHVEDEQLAVIDVVPGAAPVTVPVELTEATCGCEECQSRVIDVKLTPVLSTTSAVSACVALAATVNAAAVELGR